MTGLVFEAQEAAGGVNSIHAPIMTPQGVWEAGSSQEDRVGWLSEAVSVPVIARLLSKKAGPRFLMPSRVMGTVVAYFRLIELLFFAFGVLPYVRLCVYLASD